MMKNPRRKYQQLFNYEEGRKLTSTISKPLPECSDNDLHWLVVYFAISIVQFNILLFQFKDVTNHAYDGSQGVESIQTCQDDPEEIQDDP